jgi:hypothetical protein
MELTVIEMGKDIVVTAVDHELDAYCVFCKLNANQGHDAFIVITKWFVSRQFRGRGIDASCLEQPFVKPKPDTPACSFIL